MIDIIKNNVKEEITSIELISETSNKVYKITTIEGSILYAKFYELKSSHIDNELKIYDLVDNKYLKEIYHKSNDLSFAIFYEAKGTTIDLLSKEELEKNSDKIIYSLCDYFNCISKSKTQGYGILDRNLHGTSESFLDFLTTRQKETAEILKDYSNLSNLFDKIINKYENILYADNSLVPIDTNLKNIMLLDNGHIKFIDPGEMISGPILMGYGDFAAHTYNTILYEKLIKKLELSPIQEKQLRIYAIFSSLNILAFLKKNGVTELNTVIPFGNTYTFFDLIDEHCKFLGL